MSPTDPAPDPDQPLTGGCLCAAVRFEVRGPAKSVHYCHCSMCRRATGSPAATLVWVETADLAWTAGEPALHRSSPVSDRGFCRRCGTPLLLRYDGETRTALTVGSFDAPETLAPRYHYGVEGRLPWNDAGQGLPERETESDLAARVRGEGG